MQSPAANTIGTVVSPSGPIAGTWPPRSGAKTVVAPATSKSSTTGTAPVASTTVSQAIVAIGAPPSSDTTVTRSTSLCPAARPIMAPVRILTPEAARRAQPAASTGSAEASTTAATVSPAARAASAKHVASAPEPSTVTVRLSSA